MRVIAQKFDGGTNKSEVMKSHVDTGREQIQRCGLMQNIRSNNIFKNMNERQKNFNSDCVMRKQLTQRGYVNCIIDDLKLFA